MYTYKSTTYLWKYKTKRGNIQLKDGNDISKAITLKQILEYLSKELVQVYEDVQ